MPDVTLIHQAAAPNDDAGGTKFVQKCARCGVTLREYDNPDALTAANSQKAREYLDALAALEWSEGFVADDTLEALGLGIPADDERLCPIP